MREIVAVFIGGGLGSLLRFGISKGLESYTNSSLTRFPFTFPLATFIANIISCLLVGMFIALLDSKILINPVYKNLLIVGFCGGFSTFSTLIRENGIFIQEGKIWYSFVYTLSSLCIGIFIFFLGLWIGRKWVG